MMTQTTKITVVSMFVLALAITSGAGAARAAEEVPLPQHNWGFTGIFGVFDRAALHRGFQVYKEVCSSCHSMKRVVYRNLMDIGFTEDEVKEIAAEYEFPGPPDDSGDPTTRSGRLTDHFKSPFPNDNAARAANGGALPPDLSLIIKARKGGPDYVYGILTGFRDQPPAGFKMREGMNYNEYFPGHEIAMPPPLSEDAVEYADGTKASVNQMAEDVVTFLTWASEPKMEQRKRLGVKVILFMIVLTALLYALKRKIWSRIH